MTVRYSLDIDEVVAAYLAARSTAAKSLGIRQLTQPVNLTPEDLDAFMQDRQATIIKALNQYIGDNLEEFFSGLGSLVSTEDHTAIRRAAAAGHELFWVSSRSYFSGHNEPAEVSRMHDITLTWLLDNDLPADAAHVVLTPDKAAAVRQYDIRYHLDDSVPHVTSVALQTTAKVFLLRRPHNQRFVVMNSSQTDGDHESSAGAYGVTEVDSIAEFVTLVGAGA